MNTFFTSDLHFDDDRFDISMRPFKDTNEQTDFLIKKWNSKISNSDTVYVLGDLFIKKFNPNIIKQLNGSKILVKGNYENLSNDIYEKYFDKVCDNLVLNIKKNGKDHQVYINHYPEKCREDIFNICGHVHSAWRVQKNMINVGVDAWHFLPVSISEILFVKNAIDNHFDKNIFAGELEQNSDKIKWS